MRRGAVDAALRLAAALAIVVAAAPAPVRPWTPAPVRPAAPAPRRPPAPVPSRPRAPADPCQEWARSGGFARVYWVDAAHPAASDRGPGTQERPWRTPGPARAPGVLRPGDALVFRAGRYRSAIRPAAAGAAGAPITFAACPGEAVTITGADPLVVPWERDGAGPAWRTDAFETRGPVGGRHDRHLVVAAGTVLRRVQDVADLEPGTFRLDPLGDERALLTVRLPRDEDPNGTAMETARRGTLFGPPEASETCPDGAGAGRYRLAGIVFEHAGNTAQRGAVCLGGEDVVAEDVTVRWTNGLGIEMVGRRHTLRRALSADNGQAGVGGMCDDCLLEDVRSDRNNWLGHDPFWEAGGGKWTLTRRTTFLRYAARDNRGVGLWFDGDATDNRVIDADITGSEVAALMFELGSDRNRVAGGRFEGTRYRAWSGAGILQQAAGDNTVNGALITGNDGPGIWVRLDDRVPTGAVTVIGSTLTGNAVAGRDGDFEITLEIDVEPGAPPPPFRFEGNVAKPLRPRGALGVARDRRSPLVAVDPASWFGRADAVRVER